MRAIRFFILGLRECRCDLTTHVPGYRDFKWYERGRAFGHWCMGW